MSRREMEQESYQPRKQREQSMKQRRKKRRKRQALRNILKVLMVLLVLFLLMFGFCLGKAAVNLFENGEFRLPWAFGKVDVVLDAGHGGKDAGADSEGIYEKDINLAITQKVQAMLEEQGYQVGMVREDDSFVELRERIEYANRREAKVFVSIHCNSSEETANGIETFYAESKENDSRELAEIIQRHVIEETNARDREEKTEDYAVILHTDMSAALVEVGFLNNSDERYLLQTEDYQDKLAKGIAEGILEYLKE